MKNNNKICILGDSHFGIRNDSLTFHTYFEKFYCDVFFPYLKKHNIKTIYQLGDLFDRRKYINFNTVYRTRKYFFDKLIEYDIKMVTLVGNHDIYYKNTLEVNSPTLLLGEYSSHIDIVTSPRTDNVGGVNIDIIPWICDENYADVFAYINSSSSGICFGHFAINGFEMDKGTVCDVGIDRKTLSRYDMVLSGHFHHKSDNGHIFYVGAPAEYTWADHNDLRGFHIFDMTTRDMEFIENPYFMFSKVKYDDESQDVVYWTEFDYSLFSGSYVKLINVNKTNPYLFDKVVDNFLRVGVSDISVVEDVLSDGFTEEEDEIVDQAEDTITILSKYIDNSTLNVDTSKLKTIMRDIYIESLDQQRNSVL